MSYPAELLVTPIIPRDIAPPGLPNPISVQAFFLTLSNLTLRIASLNIFFQTPLTIPEEKLRKLQFFISDESGSRMIAADIIRNRTQFFVRASIRLLPYSTVLLLIQPELIDLIRDPANVDFSLRGLVFLNSDLQEGSVIASPQIRGTFFQFDEDTSELMLQDRNLGNISIPHQLLELPMIDSDKEYELAIEAAVNSISSGQNITASILSQALQQANLPERKTTEILLDRPPALSIYSQQAYSLTTFEI